MSHVKQGTLTHRGRVVKHFNKLNWKAITTAILVTALAWGAWNYLGSRTNQAKFEQQLKVQAQELDSKIKELETTSKNASELKLKTQELLKQKKSLESQLQAKAKQKRAVVVAQGLPANCSELMSQAGVTDTLYASILIDKESNCNPYAVNASSGACGIAQELPCGKSGCKWGDAVCQVKWMQSYVFNRYGSWEKAVRFHERNNWY
jgi:hypothetical protein